MAGIDPNIQLLGQLPYKPEARYFTAEKFAKALLKLPAGWRKMQYLDIRFTEHQRGIVAACKDLPPIYYIGGEWVQWWK